jgi:hypothetical protein
MEPGPSSPQLCPYAQSLHDFTTKLCEEVMKNPSHVLINQNRLMILHRFLELYSSAPKQHRGIWKGHACLASVFMDAMLTLRDCELTLSPPQLYIPPPAQPIVVSQPQIAGVFIGELEDA